VYDIPQLASLAALILLIQLAFSQPIFWIFIIESTHGSTDTV